MRQARAAMRSGAASARAAASENLRAGNPKWQPGLSPLEEEERIKVVMPTNAQQVRQINTMIDTLMQDGNLDSDVRKALAMWKVNYQMESVPDQVRRAFLEGFWCWLLGRGTPEQTKRTLWGRANVAAHNSEVAAYLELFARKRTEYAARLILMAEHVPDTLVGFYLYYKYIVCGAAKKIRDPGDPTKWFWDLSDEQFLEDWDLFEQEGGNYAHMIEPAAHRLPSKPPFGGEGAHPTDPYPATAEDRKLEACMDNLAKQIFNLNQSLSLSHVDSNASMSLKARRRVSTEPGTLAGAEVVMAQIHDSEEEFDPDGGDGKDDELDKSAALAEQLSESVAASRELTSSIREFIDEQRKRMASPPSHVKPRGERAAAREEAVAENEELKAAAGVDDTPEAKQRVANAAAVLQAMEFMSPPNTPMSPPNKNVETLTGTSPTKALTVADLEAHKLQLAVKHADQLARAQGDKAAVQRAQQAELAAIDAYIAAHHMVESLSLSDLHSSGTMAALSTAQTPLPPKGKEELESSGVVLADSGTALPPLEQSSSEGTPLGVLVARQRMRAIATAPTESRKVTERDSDGEVIEGKELGFGDSEGSSAALSEHSSDRDFVVSDSAVESSAAVSSAQEQTATISDGSEIADSLMDVSAIMQASSDASFEPAAKEVAKAAVAVQKAVTRASKKKEEELKKQVKFSGTTKDV